MEVVYSDARMTAAVIILSSILLLAVAALVWLLRSRDAAEASPALQLMQQQVDALRQQVAQSLEQNAALVQRQLQSVSQNLQSSSTDINQRLDHAAKLYADLRNQLGGLAQANQQIQAMVKDVATLQDILRPPKLRGGMGEVLLENLLREILPPEHYGLQHHFKDGQIVDAVIQLKEGLVPVDAKFPLENFRRMLEAKSDEERKAARKEFARNVKKHIDNIHEKYVRTDEGTFPFALMYIPAENVYYETIIKGEEEDGEKALYAYATSRQVMPVSPNSFYAYLLTLAQGFRGMRIEERAKDILQHLNRMKQELDRFNEDFRRVGLHLANAQTKYSEAEKRLARFEDKFDAAGALDAGAPESASPAADRLPAP